jgi:hypothetical protein
MCAPGATATTGVVCQLGVVGQIAEAKAVDQVFKHRPMTYGMQYVT